MTCITECDSKLYIPVTLIALQPLFVVVTDVALLSFLVEEPLVAEWAGVWHQLLSAVNLDHVGSEFGALGVFGEADFASVK